MTEFISRDEVLEHSEYTENFNLVVPVRFIKAMKAADVQPVKHGRWEYIRNVKLSGTIKLCECNQCHNKIFGGLSYCGNCGARMDGDTNG